MTEPPVIAPLLELKSISKSFRDNNGRSINAVNNVEFSLEKGKCIGVVGESGCGKSTLARVICHLTSTDQGSIHFKGQDITNLKGDSLKQYRRRVQMIFQDPQATFSPRMNIRTYLMEPFLNHKLMKKKDARAYCLELLEQVGLPADFAKRHPGELSGGQLQRVVIARSIGLKPDIIISDECTSALDVTIQKQIIGLFMELKERTGFSTLFITHNLALAEEICEQIHIMKDGIFVETVKSPNIMKHARHPYTKELLDSVFCISRR